MPTYYIMPAGIGMAETVAAEMPDAATIAANTWLPEAALAVYAEEYGRTGFQGGLQSYRCTTSGQAAAEMRLFAGRGIEVPACFIAGASDWGIHQKPGEFELMQGQGCRDLRGLHLVPGAGHWVQQEQAGQVAGLIRDFLHRLGKA
jgi:pimeloyl-ACP methyl ester carboxylesterase